MSLEKKIDRYSIISFLGLGLSVGALSAIVPFPVLVMFSIGLGIMLGAIFMSIFAIVEKGDLKEGKFHRTKG